MYFWKNKDEIVFVSPEGGFYSTAKINPQIEVTEVEEVRVKRETMDSQKESEVLAQVKETAKEEKNYLVYNSHNKTFYTYGIHPSLLQSKIGNYVILPHKYSEIIDDWNYFDSGKKLIKIKDISSDKILVGILMSKIDGRTFYKVDNSYPKWSPTTSMVLFDMNNPEGVRLVYILILDEIELTIRPLIEKYSRLKIFPSGGIAESYSSPCWSPDGKYFASTHHVPKGLNIKYAFNMKKYIYIHNIETGKGIDLIEGENPDWIE